MGLWKRGRELGPPFLSAANLGKRVFSGLSGDASGGSRTFCMLAPVINGRHATCKSAMNRRKL